MNAETVRTVGTVRCYRYANWRRGRNVIGNLVADCIAPLPPHTIWVIEVPDEKARNGHWLYRMRSGRLPKCIPSEMEGQRVSFTARVELWAGGNGAYMSAVKVHGFDG